MGIVVFIAGSLTTRIGIIVAAVVYSRFVV